MVRIRPLLWRFAWVLVRFVTEPVRLALVHKVQGEIPRGPVLLAAKHVSSFDIPVLSELVHRIRGQVPYFQMGSFAGYRVLGAITPLLTRLGGFPVMRPKDVRRLVQKLGMDRREALELMKRTNDEAEETRRELLRRGEVLVVYPEGTRSADKVAPLKATLEIDSALALAKEEGTAVQVWPVVLSFGKRRFFRRPARFHFLKAFALDAATESGEVLDRIEGLFKEHWIAPEQMDVGEPRV